MQTPRAIFFDFNGTLSADEDMLVEIYVELFAERGRPLTHAQYFDQLAGLGDLGIFRLWMGNGEDDYDVADYEDFLSERIARYIALADGSTISEAACEAVRYAAERVPVAVVSGASSVEIDAVLRAAGIRERVFTVVGVDRVKNAKPDPEAYLLALSELEAHIGEAVNASEVLTIEDTVPGIAAAKSAGLSCLAITGTTPVERLIGADAVIDVINVDLVQRLLAGRLA